MSKTKVLYDRLFFAMEEHDPEFRSQKVVVPLVTSLVRPQSVVDVGCGVGRWLVMFKEFGVKRILGLDGNYVDPKWLEIPPECFRPVDFRKPFRLDEEFDLAVCLEVAEHLPESSARTFVDCLVRLAPIILFSAAIPLQCGVGHVNEQWPVYWQRLFKEHDFRMLDLIRPHIWKNPEVKFWYRQNMFLFVREDFMSRRIEFLEAANYADDLLLINPQIFERYFGLRSLSRALPKRLWEVLNRSIRKLWAAG